MNSASSAQSPPWDDWLTALAIEYPERDFAQLHACINKIEQQPNSVPAHERAMAQQTVSLLLQLKSDMDCCVAATLLCINQTLNWDTLTLTSTKIGKLLLGIERLDNIKQLYKISPNTDPHVQADNVRKLLLAMIDDIRIVVIKLAHAAIELKHSKQADADIKIQRATDAMNIYAPLASRLGLSQIKWQLEDIAFRYLDPDTYFTISKGLKLRRVEREAFVNEMKETLTTLFQSAGIDGPELSGRVKHIYSIHKKMQRKKITLEDLFDTTALRILVASTEECYQALSLIHAHWPHISAEFDDYITQPKPNGYQSIHTAVEVEGKGNVEIQVRTFDMHAQAELGIAAHWQYKEGAKATVDHYAKKIALLRQVLDWQADISDDSQQQQFTDILADRIYVFSPDGEIFDLPNGATSLDFAYLIHTQVGHRCRGAKVNGKMIQLTQPLKTGDQITIITCKQDQPSRDWLNPNAGYLKTNQALSKVRLYFRKAEFDTNVNQGQLIWDKARRKLQLSKSALEAVAAQFNLHSQQDLLAALGNGDINITAVTNKISEQNTESKTSDNRTHETAISTASQVSPKHRIKPSDSLFYVEGVGDLLTQTAGCCKPIPGDTIIGYITLARGVTVHRSDCKNFQHLQQTHPERTLEVSWKPHEHQFSVDLSLFADDRHGLINDLTVLINSLNVTILSLNCSLNQENRQVYINLSLNMNSTALFEKLLTQLKMIPDMISVKRK